MREVSWRGISPGFSLQGPEVVVLGSDREGAWSHL